MIDPLSKQTFIDNMRKAEEGPDVSGNAIKRFWDWAYAGEEGDVQTCAFPVPTEDKSPDEMGTGHWIHARTYEEFRDFCSTYSGMWRYHIYSGVNTLNKEPENGRGGAKHITEVNHLSFDIELERDSYQGSTKNDVWWCYKYALAQAKFMNQEYGVWPMIVMSENGIHMHYKVDFTTDEEKMIGKSHKYTKYLTHQSMDSEHAEIIENKAPSYVNFAQDDVSDVPRVMKVPGTRGIKSENGRLCGIVHEPSLEKAGVITPDQVDVPDDFNKEKEKSQSSDESFENEGKVDVEPEKASDETITRVKSLCKKEKLFRQLFRGEIASYDSRSEAEFAFIMKMLNHGFKAEEINEVMWASGMSKWDEESDHYRERSIEKALDRFDGYVQKDSTNGTFSFSRRS